MDQARRGEGHQFGLLLAPTGERGGPLARTAQGEYLLASLDDAAIDQTCHHGRKFARDDREHGLIEKRQSRRNLSLLNETAALHVPRASDQIRIFKARG